MSIRPYEIRQSASQIQRLTDEAKRSSNEINSNINRTQQYWKGAAASAFQSSGQELSSRTSSLLGKAQQLESEMRRLESSVQRAEEERERKRLEAERLAAQAREAARNKNK
ncbi:WXG100 family type VII secretion target [Paenibacillus sp. 1001270B_150601_E10]|uniref:WXG100 family type VII secretion target n=1 Tax=Paenibacillus sp. 1001270B_150601_E10 TaxID=2787079 RepID=UPI00189F928D|nr:WXG100 family type VII secretion target [Paenibacillus sp. 1001270B_150601_E10]